MSDSSIGETAQSAGLSAAAVHDQNQGAPSAHDSDHDASIATQNSDELLRRVAITIQRQWGSRRAGGRIGRVTPAKQQALVETAKRAAAKSMQVELGDTEILAPLPNNNTKTADGGDDSISDLSDDGVEHQSLPTGYKVRKSKQTTAPTNPGNTNTNPNKDNDNNKHGKCKPPELLLSLYRCGRRTIC